MWHRYYATAFNRVPRSLSELRACVDQERCSTFYARTSIETHSSTPYLDWWAASTAAEQGGRAAERAAEQGERAGGRLAGVSDEAPSETVEPLPIPCFRNARYEPYVVLPNLPSTPLYSEACYL